MLLAYMVLIGKSKVACMCFARLLSVHPGCLSGPVLGRMLLKFLCSFKVDLVANSF